MEDRPGGAQPFFTTSLKDPTKATRVFWKPHMLKVPIFRQAVRTADGFQTSKYKGLRYSTYAYYLDRLGWEAGFEQKLTAYCARRCTGNAVDGKRNQHTLPSFPKTNGFLQGQRLLRFVTRLCDMTRTRGPLIRHTLIPGSVSISSRL